METRTATTRALLGMAYKNELTGNGFLSRLFFDAFEATTETNMKIYVYEEKAPSDGRRVWVAYREPAAEGSGRPAGFICMSYTSAEDALQEAKHNIQWANFRPILRITDEFTQEYGNESSR